MTMKTVTALCAGMMLAGCLPAIETGGAGTTKSGDPVAGAMRFDQNTNIYNFTIQSPKGWTCRSSFERSGQNMRVRSVPLKCDDGRTGTLLLSSNQFQGQAVGSFSINGGEAGQVVFGNL